ncbi:16S rRNA (guanine(527)-N(7))-methyltransferase RsmG [Candidatus Dependentiae bacterium]|nr:16S rRNA (guanine(527)-N(7))-methyltransferase RsmG [Candidatus Dependentiae bacterium]
MILQNTLEDPVWDDFYKRYNLTPGQLQAFKYYCHLLVTMNAQFNLTAITDVSRIVTDHFEDSLAIRDFIDINAMTGIADIGSGAGFPGLPLKIMHPQVPLVLIEVSAKKREFLASIVNSLGLSDVIISDLDWRTFLRKTDYEIDLFCARASLQPEELIRIFKPESPYKNAHLIYWASRFWSPSRLLVPFVERQESYKVGEKQRSFIFFSVK